MDTLVIATRNFHKAAEIRSILGEDFRYLTLQDLPGAPAVIENAATFAANATKKAVELSNWLAADEKPALPGRMLVLADDSGLEVDALNGAPGVHSARFAARNPGTMGNASDHENLMKLLHLLKDVSAEKRSARFRCVLALTPVSRQAALPASPVCYADEVELRTELFEGVCEGRIGFEPRGAGGFGYDPVFLPEGESLSFAELGEDVKNRISHRARALDRLRNRLARPI